MAYAYLQSVELWCQRCNKVQVAQPWGEHIKKCCSDPEITVKDYTLGNC